ncbi:hypothetical protein PsAD2_03409 [Pseudovibrio axinellae]|uniref:Uncharacterized protein n=1 Tax=Pseudovibrio axinellae TaxID=989403 RepID=A0A165WQH7_9HYPH|nr:hypothetical protein [Pseudovibrio axinellae]KZL16792.1 hypothetical protein PsAD2_03409 [Pseudovibrio axinellae]SEQ74431.1 hypothetical protein SAMN05421798_104101 [Pseudovibrio axinellae]
MISYVTVGADDIVRAKRFYSAFLPALNYGLEESPEGLSYALPEQPQSATFAASRELGQRAEGRSRKRSPEHCIPKTYQR